VDSLGLYFSIPFCKSKCTYCNFASGVFPSSYFERYVKRIEEDLHGMRSLVERWSAQFTERVNSVYFGGGTPSLLPADLIRRLFAGINSTFVIDTSSEITMECAPGQIEDAALAAMIESGVNRLSFGVQSFIDEEAKHTGRLHTPAVVLRDIDRVRRAGIGHMNLDLIAGLPGQTRASWRESLAVLCSADPDHASVYMLEVDDDSRLGREIGSGGLKYYAPQVPADDAIADLYIEAAEILTANGLAQYEISNFAASGAESRHNLKYWQRKPYLGFGLDAHSMLRDANGCALRFATTDELEPFLNSAEWTEPQALTREEELEEAWFLGLRLNEGVSLAELRAEFGEDAVSRFDPILADLASNELIECGEGRVRLTMQGRLLSNEVFSRFLAEPVNA
jgi:oxygen-independent coproporphyrinogen III oxidase